MTLFNPQQLEAIQKLGKNVIVSASAGAGKTTVLVARLMKRILEDNVRIDEICALTFTEAAATEMKERLLFELNETLSQESLTQTKRSFLEEQLALVETANISTIHAFCLELIKNYGYVLGLNPKRSDNIIDTAMVDQYKQEAMNTVFQSWLIHKEQAINRLLDVFVKRPTYVEPLYQAVFDTASFLLSKPNQENTIKESIQLYTVQSIASLPFDIRQNWHQYYDLHLIMLEEVLKEMIAEADTIDHKKAPEASSLYLDVLERLRWDRKALNPDSMDSIESILKTLNFKIISIPKEETYKLLCDKFVDVMDAMLKMYEPFDQIIETLNQQAPIILDLFNMAQDFIETYNNIKERIEGYDFDDFEQLALKVLEHNDGYVSRMLKEHYKEIMVDEFQDTNAFQDAIIRSISYGNNIFRVGDVKQSIYRFRGAKPQIMQDLIADGKADNLFLNYNYRSKEDIVAYNNDVFSKLLKYTPSMRYDTQDFVNPGTPKQKSNSVPVSLDLYFNDLENVTLKGTEHARLIAQKVIEMHESGYAFRDIVILIRGHAYKTHLKKAFEEMNIPHFIDDRGGFYKTNINAQIISWFEYAITQHDYHLVHILTSPFIGYTEDQVAQLRIDHSGSLKSALYQSDFKTYTLIHDLCLSFKESDVLTALLNIVNLNHVYRDKLSIQAKTNVDALIDKTIQFQANNNPSIFDFVYFIQKVDDERNSEAIPLNEKDDVVTAMTYHTSKGLQFPVVIVWPTGAQTNRDSYALHFTDDRYGLSVIDTPGIYPVKRKSILRKLAEFKQDNEDLEEYLRLLYVALTRAQERLVILDLVKDLPDTTLSTYLMYHFKRASDLLYAAKSKHVVVSQTAYSDVKFTPLRKTVEKSQSFINKPLLVTKFDEPTKRKDKGFDFNPDFVHAVGYGNALHEALMVLPHKEWNLDDLKNIDKNLHTTLMRYNTHAFTQEIYKSAQSIEHEMPFMMRENQQTHQGIIDFYALTEDAIILVDFKSDAVDEATLTLRYYDQLQQYKKALNHQYPERVCLLYIYSFYNNTYIPISS